MNEGQPYLWECVCEVHESMCSYVCVSGGDTGCVTVRVAEGKRPKWNEKGIWMWSAAQKWPQGGWEAPGTVESVAYFLITCFAS